MCDNHHVKNANSIDRRSFFTSGATTAAGAYFALNSPSLFGKAIETTAKEPHFFLQLFIPGGVNASYLFDARPLAMTSEKLLVNYRGKEAIPYTGINGGSCLRTEITDVLMPHKDYFSVVNGILMSASFDGHEENESYFLTGQPLGGALLFDDLLVSPRAPINAVRLGNFLGSDGRNTADGMLKLTDSVGYILTDAIKRSGDNAFNPTALSRLMHRLQVRPGDKSSRAASKAKMADALTHVTDMKDRISKLEFSKPEGGNESPDIANPGAGRPVKKDIETIVNLFKGHLTNSAMYVFSGNIDTHDEKSARDLGTVLTKIMSDVADTLQVLRDTPYDDKRSMLDMTTVVVGSEFSRTMRQTYMPFDKSGTDHNPLTNSVLIAGKGIKGGVVLGASDFASVEEYKAKGSGAHKNRDAKLEKFMARPFNFAAQTHTMDLPAEFNAEHYLNIGSVINTVYDSLGIPNDKWRALARGTPKNQILKALRS